MYIEMGQKLKGKATNGVCLLSVAPQQASRASRMALVIFVIDPFSAELCQDISSIFDHGSHYIHCISYYSALRQTFMYVVVL